MTPTKPKFDLGKQADTRAACNNTMEIELKFEGVSTGIFWSVTGKDGDVFDNALNDQIDAANFAAAEARKRGRTVPPKPQHQVEEEQNDLLVVASTGWRNMLVDGKEIDFTVPNAKMVLARFPWIRKQVDDAVGDVAAFTKAWLQN